MIETLHPVELIGKHLDRNNLRLTNYAINSKCAISGKDITQGILVTDLVSDVFTDWQYIRHGKYVSIEAALCIAEVIKTDKGYNSLRNYSYIATPDKFQFLKREHILDTLLTLNESQFCIAVSYSFKKHLSYKCVLNEQSESFYITTDVGTFLFDKNKVRDFLPILQSQYSISTKDFTYFTKQDIAAGYGLSAVAFVLFLVFNIFIIVQPGSVGVPIVFGKIGNHTLPSGLQVVNPLAKITKFDTRTQNYTMSAVHDEGIKSGDDAIRVLSKDGLEVTIDVSILYRVLPDKTPQILSTIGTDYEAKIVRPLSRTRIRDNAAYYDAVSLYAEKRDIFQNQIFLSLEKDFNARGLILEQILVRNIVLPASVKASIESKINAEQDAQKMEFVLQKEKQEAERKRVEAQGIADYQKIINTGLSQQQIQYETIKAYKELATSQNAKVIVMGGGNQPLILDAK